VVTHMENGNIDATMVQRAYFYGYLSTYVAYAMAVVGVDDTMAALSEKLTGDDGDLLNTGIDVLTPDNLEDYNAYSTECLGL
jgi:ribose transport system substrate-binding protein